MQTNKLTEPQPERAIVVLIDGENAQSPETIENILQVASAYGIVKVRRIYGNWLSTHMHRWKPYLDRFAFQPVQLFPKSSGKNAVDIALVVDAMDLLFQGYRGFCLVASDSDYSSLVVRLRQEGSMVIGIGQQHGTALADVCDKFLTIDDIRLLPGHAILENLETGMIEELDDKLADILLEIFYHTRAKNPDKPVSLPPYGSTFRQRYSSFDPSEYGITGKPKLKKAIQERQMLFTFAKPTNGKAGTDTFMLCDQPPIPYRIKALRIAYLVAYEQSSVESEWVQWKDMVQKVRLIEPRLSQLLREKAVRVSLQRLITTMFERNKQQGIEVVRFRKKHR
jgi:hypothetical protein